MSQDCEPFFTPHEWKATVLFRPGEWREWWRAEPLLTKVAAALVLVIFGWAIYELLRGNSDTGAILIALVGLLLATPVFLAFANVFVAGLRWMLRKSGLLATWLSVRKGVLTIGKVVLWTSIVGWFLAALWPYISLDPVKSWYAVTHEVPVDRVEIEKEPHDCEFATSPIGSKHCHYEARFLVTKGDQSAKTERSLIVGYEKIED